jgi:hypothetical protein
MRYRARFANDSTPWENGEFGMVKVETLFRATLGSGFGVSGFALLHPTYGCLDY